MESNNTNEAITHVAMPERQIPVLIDEKDASQFGLRSGGAEGFFSYGVLGGADSRTIRVRRVQPQCVVDLLTNAQRRQKLEHEYGTEWDSLRDFLALMARVNTGDYSPILKSTKPDVSVRREGRIRHVEIRFNVTGKSIPFAVSEVFTNGLGKARFVVWWSIVAKRFVTGLYCPDVVTALYVSILSNIGTSGGISVCQKCTTPFIRSRSKQLYCTHKCQVAAGMRRYRESLERAARAKSKTTAKREGRTGGK